MVDGMRKCQPRHKSLALVRDACWIKYFYKFLRRKQKFVFKLVLQEKFCPNWHVVTIYQKLKHNTAAAMKFASRLKFEQPIQIDKRQAANKRLDCS